MENRKTVTPGSAFRAVAPVLLYYLVSFAVSTLVMQRVMMEAGYAVLESAVEESGYMEYLLREYAGKTMLTVLLTCLLALPFFLRMYLKDQERRSERQPGTFRLMIDVPVCIRGAFASAMLALFLNNVLMASPLASWSARYQEISESMYSSGILMELAASVLAASVTEELMMRGLVYKRMREFMTARTAIFASALLFGVMHGNLLQGVYGFLAGLFLAWLTERFGTILLPILAHMAANLLLVLMTESGALEMLGGLLPAYWAVTALCGAAFLWAFRELGAMGREQQ